MEQDHAARGHVRLPILKILPATLLGVIAIDKNEIQWPAPVFDRIEAEISYELDAASPAAIDNDPADPVTAAHSRDAVRYERIDQRQDRLGVDHLPQDEGGTAFEEADLDQRAAVAAPFLQHRDVVRC